MICPVSKQAEMQEVSETSPLNTTFKCLNCGAEVVKAKTDSAYDENQFVAVFIRQPDGSMQEVNLNDIKK